MSFSGMFDRYRHDASTRSALDISHSMYANGPSRTRADNVAVIGQDRPRVGTEEPSCQQRFLALIFDWQRGRISLSHEVEEIPPELAGTRPASFLEPWPQGEMVQHTEVGNELCLALDVPALQMRAADVLRQNMGDEAWEQATTPPSASRRTRGLGR